MTQAKRRRVAPDIWVGGDLDEAGVDPVQHSWFTYLSQMRLYFLSLAMAGSSKLEPQPAASERATTSSTDYVQVPLHLLMRYLCRAESLALKIPERQRLSHLEALDRAERAECAHRLANSSQSLGRIISAVFVERDSHWTVPLPPPPPVGSATNASARPPPAAPPRRGNDGAGPSFAEALRDGKRLCADYQRGKCSREREKQCSAGEHRCAVQFSTGRVCGSPKHIGNRCPDAPLVPTSESRSSRGVALQSLCQTICSPQISADPWTCCDPHLISLVTLMTACQKSPVSLICFQVLGFHSRLLFNGQVVERVTAHRL